MLARPTRNVKPLTEQQIEDLFICAKVNFGDSIAPSDVIGVLMEADEFEYGRCYEDFSDEELWSLHGSSGIAISPIPSGYTLENKRWLVQLAALVGYEYIMDVLRAIQKAYHEENRKYKLMRESFSDGIR